MRKWILLFITTTVIFSCEKGPGDGGTSVIKGKVFIKDYNSVGQLQAEYYAQEERVYLIYGDGDFYGQDTRTSFDGSYEFNYLRKGSYTVFAYSKCDTCTSGQEPTMITTEITDNHSTVILPDLVLIR